MLEIVFSLLAFLSSFLPQPTITEGLVGQPKSLIPIEITTNQPDQDIARFIHRALLKYNERGDLVPDLAESYKVSDDSKEYTFNLQKNLHWHNGKEFTSDDVIFTLSKENLGVIEADKLGKYTVRFRLIKDAYTPFLDLMTRFILPEDFGKVIKSSLYVNGLGDFRVARVKKSERVDSIILTPAWPWKKNDYKFSRIIFKFYKNQDDLVTAANIGEVDAFSQIARAGNFIPGFNHLVKTLSSRYYAIFFNLNDDKLKDKELRKLLSSITPKELIVKEVFGGSVTIANSPLEATFVKPETEVKREPGTIPTGKKYGGLVLRLVVPENSASAGDKGPSLYKVAVILKEAYGQSGINLEIKTVPGSKIFDEVITKKQFELLLYGQEVGRDPDVYSLWHSTQKDLPGLNFTGFASPLADRALEEGRKEPKKEERQRHYLNFIKAFNEEVPAIFLYHPNIIYYYKDSISGPTLENLYIPADRFLNFQTWSRS